MEGARGDIENVRKNAPGCRLEVDREYFGRLRRVFFRFTQQGVRHEATQTLAQLSLSLSLSLDITEQIEAGLYLHLVAIRSSTSWECEPINWLTLHSTRAGNNLGFEPSSRASATRVYVRAWITYTYGATTDLKPGQNEFASRGRDGAKALSKMNPRTPEDELSEYP